jgi:hypothetical protein
MFNVNIESEIILLENEVNSNNSKTQNSKTPQNTLHIDIEKARIQRVIYLHLLKDK